MLPFLLWLGVVMATDGVRLQGYDDLARAGTEVQLRAKLEKDGILGTHPDWKGQWVQFLADGEVLGTATTKGDGVAALSWTVPPLGEGSSRRTWSMTARLHDAEGVVVTESSFVLTAVAADVPVLVVDLDGTVCLGSMMDVMDEPPEEVPAFEGAAAALRRLEAHYQVLYLTARDDSLLERSRRWLRYHGFPAQPLLVRDLKLTNLSAESFKTRRLKELGQRFRLVAGVGDREEDAKAYVACDLYAILVGDEDDVPARASKVTTWDEVERLLTPTRGAQPGR